PLHDALPISTATRDRRPRGSVVLVGVVVNLALELAVGIVVRLAMCGRDHVALLLGDEVDALDDELAVHLLGVLRAFQALLQLHLLLEFTLFVGPGFLLHLLEVLDDHVGALALVTPTAAVLGLAGELLLVLHDGLDLDALFVAALVVSAVVSAVAAPAVTAPAV